MRSNGSFTERIFGQEMANSNDENNNSESSEETVSYSEEEMNQSDHDEEMDRQTQIAINAIR